MGREASKQDKRDRIRAAAAELFTTRGFDETSVADIAEHAGVAKGTVFLYAESKTDLVALVFEEALLGETRAGIAALDLGGGLAVELTKLFSRFFGVYEPTPALARLVLRELSFASGHAARVRSAVDGELLGGIAAHVDARKARGEVDESVVSMLVAANAFAIYLLTLLGWLSGALPTRELAQAHLASSLELACRGLSARTTTTAPRRRAKGDER
jgi:AcrR family transcriptional regulator